MRPPLRVGTVYDFRNTPESGMDMPTSGEEVQSTSDAPSDRQDKSTRTATRAPSIIVGIVAAVIVALSVFYLLRPEPLLVQGEVDATRLDIAARVDGRVKEIPVERGQNVPAKAVLVRIDNPETVATATIPAPATRKGTAPPWSA